MHSLPSLPAGCHAGAGRYPVPNQRHLRSNLSGPRPAGVTDHFGEPFSGKPRLLRIGSHPKTSSPSLGHPGSLGHTSICHTPGGWYLDPNQSDPRSDFLGPGLRRGDESFFEHPKTRAGLPSSDPKACCHAAAACPPLSAQRFVGALRSDLDHRITRSPDHQITYSGIDHACRPPIL